MQDPIVNCRRLGRHTHLAVALGLALGLAGTAAMAGPAQAHRGAQAGPTAQLLTRSTVSGRSAPAGHATLSHHGASSANRTSNTITVTTCDDSGGGSLRAAVAFAASGDIIDMSGLSCGTIKLDSSIVTSLDDLTLKGSQQPTGYGFTLPSP